MYSLFYSPIKYFIILMKEWQGLINIFLIFHPTSKKCVSFIIFNKKVSLNLIKISLFYWTCEKECKRIIFNFELSKSIIL